MGQARKRHAGGTFNAHVKRGDQVLVLAGRSVGIQARVVSVDPQRERAIVEGANPIIKHQKSPGAGRNPAATQQQQSGRIEKPAPIHVSSLMVVCTSCNKPTRVKHHREGGKSQRCCRRCNQALDRA